MASWHKRARLGVAIFGVAIATVVYFAMGERQVASAPQAVTRSDPKAVLEINSGQYKGITGVEKNFEIEYSRFSTYDDGSAKFFDVVVTVPKEGNRTFTIRAKEAVTDKEQTDIKLSGDVRMEDSDGFSLKTDTGSFDRKQSIALAPGAVTFGKGRMSGSGIGITYHQAADVLVVSQQAQVTTRNEAGEPVMEFASSAATLDRTQNLLTVEGSVHVVRNEETIDADRAVARLSEADDVVQYLELRGNSRVEGGGGDIDAMSARDIDLDYTDDGQRLEAVKLNGGAAVAKKGDNGASEQLVAERIELQLAADQSSRMALTRNAVVTTVAGPGRGSRRIAANALALDVAPDGALTRAVGRESVRLDLPAAEGAPARSIRSNALDGTGAAGRGLTNATFTGDVIFTEEERRQGGPGGPSGGSGARTVRAQTLQASMANDAVTAATFTTDVSFEEAGLKGCAGRVEYSPEKGTLALAGDTPAGKPIVAEERMAIEAPAIDVTLESRRMSARGGVITHVGSPSRCRPAQARPQVQQSPTRLPGLMKQDVAATIKGTTLEYEGDAGKARYSGGRTSISQADTAIYGDTISLDQKNGDLTATGNAVATMPMDGGESIGRAHEITYVDAKRLIRYAAAPPPPIPLPVAPGTPPPLPPRDVQLLSPQGDLLATTRIDVVVAEKGGEVQRLDAYGSVRMKQAQRNASGAAHLRYEAATGDYVLTAGTLAPAVLVADCREMRGTTLTFNKSNDTIVVDGKREGQSERRVQNTTAGGRCTPAAPTP